MQDSAFGVWASSRGVSPLPFFPLSFPFPSFSIPSNALSVEAKKLFYLSHIYLSCSGYRFLITLYTETLNTNMYAV